MIGSELPGLVYYGNPKLMRPQEEVQSELSASRHFQSALDVLAACMDHYQGIGIAAPQVGWPYRVFCMGVRDASERYPDIEHIPFEFWINPVVESASEETNWAWEGCLSVPGMRGWVERPAVVTVSGKDEHGNAKRRELRDFTARVFLHEFDHLDGILFPMRVKDTKFLLPNESVANQKEWSENWPSPGARNTLPGGLSRVE